MTGIIKELNSHRRSGCIRAEDGSLFTFYDSSVFAGEFDFLKIGQEVSFEVSRGLNMQDAVRVQSKLSQLNSSAMPGAAEQPAATVPSKQTAAAPHFLYKGFEQPKNIRHYKFSAVVHGKPTMDFTVSVDLALFLKYHVVIQEAPALCLQKLSHADPEAPQARHKLTEGDLAAYVSDREAAAARNLERRRWQRPRKAARRPSK